uniref:Bromodomain-containing protein 8 n=1 Tax=Fundulus heteroclitus TaxID=8078 RepID=A0A3Q2PM53_FUNHE
MSKRIPSVTTHSPSASSSPSQDFPPGDQLESLTLDGPPTKNSSGTAKLITFSQTPGPANDDIGHGAILEDSAQKKLLSQKATPPPSPLLSELLKKGSILASNSRLIGDGDGSPGNVAGSHDSQLHSSCQPLSQATGAPMLSRLLEAGPAQFSSPLGFMVGADSPSCGPVSAANSAPLNQTVSESTAVDVMAPSVRPHCPADSGEDKVAELSEEDVTASYMGDELDLKTVGDIIAIIEDKADETAEALDAAAVEAALSLCEETDHALTGAWDAGPLQPQEPHPTHRMLEGGAEVSLSSLYSSQENNLSAFPLELGSLPPASSCHSKTLEHSANPTQCQGAERSSKHISTDGSAECEGEKEPPQKPEKAFKVFADSVLEDKQETDWEAQETKVEDGLGPEEGENASESKADSEVTGPELCEEEEEEGDGAEEFSSEPDGEMELEPAASESEDGYSLHTASSSLQLHTTADSIPSSPASSQFSVCSEDLEALQAHKIWKKAIMLVWRAAANHRYANVFLQPVTDEIAPGYHSIVHRPMDLATIKKNIETGLIRTTAEFQRDIMLMFQNAVMYNGLDHDVYHMALEMQRDVLEQIQQFLATQLIMETSESGISAKSLRGRDSTRRQDSTDKDTVSMSSPAFLLSLFDGGTRGRRSAIEADLKMKK